MLHGRHADDAATVADHHIDRLGRHLRRRHDEIALVLAALVIGHDDQAPGGNLGDRGFNRIEGR